MDKFYPSHLFSLYHTFFFSMLLSVKKHIMFFFFWTYNFFANHVKETQVLKDRCRIFWPFLPRNFSSLGSQVTYDSLDEVEIVRFARVSIDRILLSSHFFVYLNLIVLKCEKLHIIILSFVSWCTLSHTLFFNYFDSPPMVIPLVF